MDGVWISGSNTPVNSVPGTPQVFVKAKAAQRELSPDRTSTASTMSRIEMPQPIHSHTKVMVPSGSQDQDSASSSEPRVTPERTHKPPPTSDHQRRGQVTYRPRRSSKLRYSNSYSPEDSEDLETLEGRSSADNKNGKRPEGSHPVLQSSSLRSLVFVGSEPEVEDQEHSISWSGSSNSEYHDTPGQSHQPEQSCAFLHPTYHNTHRGRRPASYELSDIDTTVGPSTHDAHIDGKGNLLVRNRHNGMTVAYDARQDIAPQANAALKQEATDPFMTPDKTPPDDHIPSFNLDEDSATHHTQLMDRGDVANAPGHAEPLQLFDSNRQLKRAQVIRKVNSGFEILRPGTLDAPRQSSDSADWQGDGIKRQPRKLQKRGDANPYAIEEP